MGKLIIKLIVNSIIGMLLICLINKIGAIWNFHIGLNLFTSLFVRDTRNSWSDISINF